MWSEALLLAKIASGMWMILLWCKNRGILPIKLRRKGPPPKPLPSERVRPYLRPGDIQLIGTHGDIRRIEVYDCSTERWVEVGRVSAGRK